MTLKLCVTVDNMACDIRNCIATVQLIVVDLENCIGRGDIYKIGELVSFVSCSLTQIAPVAGEPQPC